MVQSILDLETKLVKHNLSTSFLSFEKMYEGISTFVFSLRGWTQSGMRRWVSTAGSYFVMPG